ncbi:MAG: acyl-CoA dehydrogenase family protein, partial [Gammaproteobacteria bacterium AqS3]|nr:acyl-CoA dehydrogenase family protein [Gammaproteobacteria bacterium AqS3]
MLNHWDDILLLQGQLSEEERMISEGARAFAQSELAPGVTQAARNETFDRGIFNAMGDAGLLGATVQGYDCPGASYVSYGLIAREIERVDSSYRSAMSVQSSLVMYPIEKYGSEAMRQEYLPRLASGEWVGCFGLTEPDSGSDPASMITRAVAVDGGWRLSGAKMWITSAPIADVFVIWAKDETDTVRGFVLRRGSEGLGTETIQGKLALRASPTGSISLDDVFVPDEGVLDIR